MYNLSPTATKQRVQQRGERGGGRLIYSLETILLRHEQLWLQKVIRHVCSARPAGPSFPWINNSFEFCLLEFLSILERNIFNYLDLYRYHLKSVVWL